jgi:hypothetical protein
VPPKPSRSASAFSAATRLRIRGLRPVPALDVPDAGGLRQLGQELVRDVARALEALVAVEELDELPAAALLACGDRGGGGVDGFLTDDREVAELDPRLAAADLGLDHLRQDILGEPLARRALQIAELDQLHSRPRLAEGQAALRDPIEVGADRRDSLQAGVPTLGLALIDHDQHGDRDDRQERRGAGKLDQALPPRPGFDLPRHAQGGVPT